MIIDVALIPDAARRAELKEQIVIVVDVLRASTSIITALANGAEKVIPVATVDEARRVASSIPQKNVLLCGEREGVKLDGFDLGNSPREYRPQVVRGKTLVFTSTNGSAMMVLAASGNSVFVGGFPNAGRVAKEAAFKQLDIMIICSGREETFSMEDCVCAGMVVENILNLSGGKSELSDAADGALRLSRSFGRDLNKMVQNTVHGKYLKSIGLAEDLPLCIDVDTLPVTPVLSNGALRLEKDREGFHGWSG